MLLCIDFQPAYEEAFFPLMGAVRRRLRRAQNEGEEVHFIYNHAFSLEGEELGDPEERLLQWAIDRDLPLQGAKLVVKNFGWVSHRFRTGIERGIAVRILSELLDRGLSSSYEISPVDLERIVATSHDQFPGFWDCSPEAWEEMRSGAIAMPYRFEMTERGAAIGMTSWLERLKQSHDRRIEIAGGYAERCLDEVCMMMEANGIGYGVNTPLLYGLSSLEVGEEMAENDAVETGKATQFPYFEELDALGV